VRRNREREGKYFSPEIEMLVSVNIFSSDKIFSFGGIRLIFIMKSKNFEDGSPLTGVILCWQECDVEEVAVAGAEDACRVAAEVPRLSLVSSSSETSVPWRTSTTIIIITNLPPSQQCQHLPRNWRDYQ
jgi:hypothetical protein